MNKEKYKFDEKGNKEEYKFSHDEYGNAVEHEGEIYDDDESVIDEDGKNCCTLCCDKTCSCLFTVACFPLKCMCNCLWTMIWVNGCGFTLNWRGWLEKMYFVLSVAHRRELKRPLWLHRTSYGGIYFTVLLVLVALMLGLFYPHMLTISFDQNPPTAMKVTQDSLSFYSVLWWTAYICWMARYWPQVILNFCRGRTIGLNVNFTMWAGVSALTMFLQLLVCVFTNRTMAFFDDRESETLHNPSIVVYCINNLLVIIILIWQAFRYDLSAQRPSTLVLGTCFMTVLVTGIYFVVNFLLLDDKASETVAVTRWLYACDLVSLFTACWKFVPQIRQNRKYQVAIGHDICSFVLEGLGALSLLLLIAIYELKENYDTGGTFSSVFGVGMRQFVLACCVLVGCFYMGAQSYIYWQMPSKADVRRGFNNRLLKNKKEENLRLQNNAGLLNYTTASNSMKMLLCCCCPALIPLQCIRKGMCCCCRDGLSCLKDLDCLDKKKDLKHQGMGVVEVTVNVGKEGKTITSFRPQWLCHSCTFSNEAENIFCAMCHSPFENVVRPVEEGGGLTAGSANEADVFDEEFAVIRYPIDHLEEI